MRIELTYDAELDVELSMRLQAALGLRHCVVIDAPEVDDDALHAALGRAAAGLPTEIVGPASTPGAAGARARPA